MFRRISTMAMGAALAVMAGPGLAQDADLGEAIYTQYCATCHGAGGQGNGPLTDLLTTQVPDLTQLSAGNDNVFPMLQVIHVIDGRTGLRAHGGPMPVYGALFSEESPSDTKYGDVLFTRGKVLSLAYYLETIQQ
ncbi:cytochrome c [Aestuariicoccus sp. MJ-SS9]|uniref:c-type cytochrome n=1 Tax=Aestuariicoccus sp. MJ-SS9 TaxID=3079855 RepID=UPI0029135BCB|nr:cytochrome c [Aestuariicoccus sp. MJ-SS9]MDU8911286.1 cytochrome c [Aestuariicoccus sp. MJ-SS9]